MIVLHGRATGTGPLSPEAGGFGDYAREVYDFDWDSEHSEAPYGRIDARALLAFKRR